MIEAGSVLTLEVEKPAAGGRMLARHHGQVVLVWGAIPGERVTARVERTGKGLAFAEIVDVLSASPDRRPAPGDWRCGGNVLAHVNYARQLQLKGDIIRDALGRIGRVPLDRSPEVIGSPERGYRMRARLHAHEGRLGFYREGSHQLCEAVGTGQLLESTNAWIASVEERLRDEPSSALTAIEIAENITGQERACHLELRAGADAARFVAMSDGLVGLSAQVADRAAVVTLAGLPVVSDTVGVRAGDSAPVLRLQRSVRAFFQGNRFLLERLLWHVMSLAPEGPILDLYAGGGFFGLALAASGVRDVTLVEGDPVSGSDLQRNVEPFAGDVRVERRSVESFLGSGTASTAATVIVDPPRTGLSKEAVGGILAMKPSRVVYVSCDVATFARDTRLLLDGGYQLGQVTGLDLFPNTAHVETVALFTPPRSG
ncbi:MAG TPA: TRAM domain-containing protein [Vicinamibacterales bacterium]|nr:TRAM domain-containing protein [Vicinamibacterales bacterium]